MRFIKSWFKRAPRIRFEPIYSPVLDHECNGFFLCEEELSMRDLERLREAAASGWRPVNWERLPSLQPLENGPRRASRGRP